MKLFTKIFSILVLFLFSLPAYAESPFELSWQKKEISIAAGTSFKIPLTVRAPDGHYLYAEETQIDFKSLEGIIIKDVIYPKAEKYSDPYMGKEVKIYKGDIEIMIVGLVPAGLKAGLKEISAELGFRGCSPKLCFRPESHDLMIEMNVLPAVSPGTSISERIEGENISVLPSDRGFFDLLKTQDFSNLTDEGTLITILIVLLAGILTSLTPCVWPVIPVVLLYIGVHPHKRFWENLLLAISLVAGLVLIYSVLGIAAVVFGKNLGFLFQNRFFLAVVVLFFLAMSLSMFGAFDLKLPSKLHHKLHKLGGKGYRGAFLAGMGMGLVASPCAGPVLAALLGHVALSRDYLYGFLLLIVYGTGMGILMVALGAGFGEFAGKLKGGLWMIWIKRILGLVLLLPAAFYMGALFHSNGMKMNMTGESRMSQIEWKYDEAAALKEAIANRKPVMIEFYAQWCPPCKALERDFFKKDEIAKLAEGFVVLKVDATIENKEIRRLIEKYKVIGWPTVIFLDSTGIPYSDLKVGNYDTDAIKNSMVKALSRSKNSR